LEEDPPEKPEVDPNDTDRRDFEKVSTPALRISTLAVVALPPIAF